MKNQRGRALCQGGSCSPALTVVTGDKNACPVSTDFQERPEIQSFMQNLLICKCWQLM